MRINTKFDIGQAVRRIGREGVVLIEDITIDNDPIDPIVYGYYDGDGEYRMKPESVLEAV